MTEIPSLLQNKKIDEAEKNLNELLDTSYSENDLIDVAVMVIAQLNSNLLKRENTKKICEKLLLKFPDDLRVKLQWIGSLIPLDPKRALIELESIKEKFPEFYEKHPLMIQIMRGNAFEYLEETDHAMAEYEQLQNIDFDNVAQNKINYFKARKQVEQDLQKKFIQTNSNNIPVQNSNHFGIIIANVVLLTVIFYINYKRKKSPNV